MGCGLIGGDDNEGESGVYALIAVDGTRWANFGILLSLLADDWEALPRTSRDNADGEIRRGP